MNTVDENRVAKKKQSGKIRKKGQIDWMITLLPLGLIAALSILFFLLPEQSNTVLAKVRFFLGDTFGVYYLAIGLGVFLLSLYLAFSKYGDIVLGEQDEKPKYSFFAWGSMMFTCGLAADILFYSFAEWVMYAADPQIEKMGGIQEWAGVYPLFHWSLIPWGFYLVLAAAFGFMLHVRKRNRQRYSEACRPIMGKQTDGIGGRLIDLLAVFALLAGTATTFSVATPLMASAINALFHINLDRNAVTIVILLITCFVYTYSLLHGFRGIGFLAKLCIYLFFGLLAYVLLFGGQTRYIIETGFSSLGRMIQYFPTLATDTDPLRETHFPQNWTIYYWAYWMVWCVAAPFFIGSISRGRTVRQTILGGYGFGVGSTILSFIILGNESMGMQMAGKADFIARYAKDGDLYGMIIAMIQKIPCASLVLVVLLLTMIAFYATSFDSIALTVSCYSYRRLEEGQQPSKAIQLMWCLLLILLPIALVFSESSMSNLQSVSIVAAFPIGMVILLIVAGFLKDAGAYLKEIKKKRFFMQHENRAGFLFGGNPAVCISDSVGLYKQCTPLSLELFDLFVNELRRYTEMLGKTLLAEKLFCAAVDKFTVGADLVMCEFFAALHTACHQSFTTFARYTFDANGSSSVTRDALFAHRFSPVQTSVSSSVWPVENGRPISSRFMAARDFSSLRLNMPIARFPFASAFT